MAPYIRAPQSIAFGGEMLGEWSALKAIVTVILAVIFASGSYGVTVVAPTTGYGDWWQQVIYICLLWILYALIARAIYEGGDTGY